MTRGSKVKVSKLNLGSVLPFVGMLILLWIPPLLDWTSTHRSVSVSNLASEIAVDEESGSEKQIKDSLQVTSAKTREDIRTEIREYADRGVMSAYWEVLLSNVGSENLSVVSYKVLQVGLVGAFEQKPTVMKLAAAER